MATAPRPRSRKRRGSGIRIRRIRIRSSIRGCHIRSCRIRRRRRIILRWCRFIFRRRRRRAARLAIYPAFDSCNVWGSGAATGSTTAGCCIGAASGRQPG